jgi:uncharacterized membrane protein HdeD (DUF308 family)
MKNSLKVLTMAVVAVAVAVPAFATPVPEIDPSMAASGLTALIGGVLVLMGRRRR